MAQGVGAQNGAPVPHPAILLTSRTLPPFLATPDPISNVYSELGAGLAAGSRQSFPGVPCTLSSLWGPCRYQNQGMIGSGPAQLEEGATPLPGLLADGPRWHSPGRAADSSQAEAQRPLSSSHLPFSTWEPPARRQEGRRGLEAQQLVLQPLPPSPQPQQRLLLQPKAESTKRPEGHLKGALGHRRDGHLRRSPRPR